ncbi:YceD family protein [Dokdonella sp.]|uniref:YceD family protein n=1 Tax=Dokdonella sp. TaxID=2291710 RepID=UPI003526CBBF
MSNTVPDILDPWRMVQARRVFEGTIPVRQLERLAGLLASPDGEVAYRVEFGNDEFDVAFADLHVEAGLSLVCQRTMQVFVQAVEIDQKLGLIRRESEEAGLPEGYEALLISDGQLRLMDVIEDELMLALPLVALSPGAPLEEFPLGAGSAPDSEQPSNPFAVLGQLKNTKH